LKIDGSPVFRAVVRGNKGARRVAQSYPLPYTAQASAMPTRFSIRSEGSTSPALRTPPVIVTMLPPNSLSTCGAHRMETPTARHRLKRNPRSKM
jgi:hypothetical protein